MASHGLPSVPPFTQKFGKFELEADECPTGSWIDGNETPKMIKLEFLLTRSLAWPRLGTASASISVVGGDPELCCRYAIVTRGTSALLELYEIDPSASEYAI